MKKLILPLFLMTLAVIGISSAHDGKPDSKPKPFSTTIYQGPIHGVRNKEIIVSIVELPAARFNHQWMSSV